MRIGRRRSCRGTGRLPTTRSPADPRAMFPAFAAASAFAEATRTLSFNFSNDRVEVGRQRCRRDCGLCARGTFCAPAEGRLFSASLQVRNQQRDDAVAQGSIWMGNLRIQLERDRLAIGVRAERCAFRQISPDKNGSECRREHAVRACRGSRRQSRRCPAPGAAAAKQHEKAARPDLACARRRFVQIGISSRILLGPSGA